MKDIKSFTGGRFVMNLKEIAELINANSLSGSEKLEEIVIPHAYACDLMSDVLAFCSPGSLLLTGLTNVQIVRTAQMLDIPAIIFVRGKVPLEETVNLAQENGIPILITKYSMYETCGILYARGIKPSYSPQQGA
jgi:predicted transcriptional regulator